MVRERGPTKESNERGPTKGSNKGVPQTGATKGSNEGVQRRGPTKGSDHGGLCRLVLDPNPCGVGRALGFGLFSPCPMRALWAHGLPSRGELSKAHHTHQVSHAGRGTRLPGYACKLLPVGTSTTGTSTRAWECAVGPRPPASFPKNCQRLAEKLSGPLDPPRRCRGGLTRGGDLGLSRSLSCVCQSPIAPRWG